MLHERDEELTNLMLLRDVVWPEVERLDAAGLLNLDYYERVQGCRTYLCILGTCCTHPVMQRRGFSLHRERFGSTTFVIPRYRGDEIRSRRLGPRGPGFGLDGDADRALFGSSEAGGTLRERRELLDTLIEARIAALEVPV